MGKSKNIFDLCFRKTRYFDIENINYDPLLRNGTCHIVCGNNTYVMIWNIRNYPVEAPEMPGAPYPVKFTYTIFDKDNKKCEDKSYRSLTGEFVYEIASGTLPVYNQLGLPYGVYFSLARNNYCHNSVCVEFSLFENEMEIIISK